MGTCRGARAGGKQTKKGKNLNWKMEVFPNSEQKSDDTSPTKHDTSDFETSIRIQIRHDLDNERELCTSNKKTLFEFFLQFFKTLERTLSSTFDSRNA